MSALRVVAAALMSACLALPVAAQARGPAEQPPADFGGRQFVDSRGCLYLRAGIGDRTMWVPRIGNDRRPMCDQAPTFGTRPAPPPVRDVAAPAPAPAPAPRAEPRVGTIPVPAAAPRPPRPVATPTPVAAEAAAPGEAAIAAALQNFCRNRTGRFNVRVAGQPRQIECRRPASASAAQVAAPSPAPAPAARAPSAPAPDMQDLLQRYCIGLPSGPFTVTVGGQAVRLQCSGSEGRTGALAPRVAAPSGTAVAAATAPVMVPRGFRPVWDDGRLNPNRGLPAPAAPDIAATRASVAPVAVPHTPGGAVSGRYVQVGAFGVPENAARAVARVQAAGLPVSTQVVTRQGRPLRMVMAGPLDPGGAARALGILRAAGYADAYLRN